MTAKQMGGPVRLLRVRRLRGFAINRQSEVLQGIDEQEQDVLHSQARNPEESG